MEQSGGDRPSALVVAAHDVSHYYGERAALNVFSLDVPRGAVFGLLGPNGSGKSTFISLLASTAPASSGSLSLFGQQPERSLRRRIGVVFQENALDPLMTVAETLALAGRLYGLKRSLIAGRSRELLDHFGLGGRAGDTVSTLSGGMRRRLEMARALLHDPDLLLLDEPTTGIDPGERRALWDGLLARQDGSRTILLATNDLAEADAHCDRAAFIKDGRVIASGTPAELKRGLRTHAVRVAWDEPSAAQIDDVASWPETGTVSRDGETVLVVCDDAAAIAKKLFDLAPSAIRGLTISSATLEDAYFQHVAGRTREGAEKEPGA
jgi:ABC-2 type transport system ATP-binding protein